VEENQSEHNPAELATDLDLDLVLQNAYGNRDFVVKMIELFLVETPDALIDMRRHLVDQNWDKLRQVSHKLKPSVNLMGIKQASSDVTNIERFALDRINLDKIGSLINRAEICLTRALLELAEEIGSH
jgi:HPt (histidine-containing phosphotransfer) domain-containing protein